MNNVIHLLVILEMSVKRLLKVSRKKELLSPVIKEVKCRISILLNTVRQSADPVVFLNAFTTT